MKTGVPPGGTIRARSTDPQGGTDDPRWSRSSSEILLHDGTGCNRPLFESGSGTKPSCGVTRMAAQFFRTGHRRCRGLQFLAGVQRGHRTASSLIRLVHPQRVKAIASAKLKNHRVDSQTLAHLSRCDLLPEAWMADRQTRERRQQVRLRISLGRHRAALKNQVHAVLHQQGNATNSAIYSAKRDARGCARQRCRPPRAPRWIPTAR